MAKAKKFDAFGGVFTPSILTILGVIMYLRLPWIVGQAGLLATLGIIFVAHIISGSTGLSVASIATDKKVESGGTYYIISRSLGLPIGGTLGWALFVGLSFSVSLYLIGFAEVFLGYFGFEVNITTIRIAGSIILMMVTILTFISTSLAIKTQYIILAAMALSLVSVFFGNHNYTPALPQMDSIPGSLPWITLFAIFFPAVTGFEAGVSMSGDLKDARKAIPRGTIMAISVGLIIYVLLAVFLSYTVKSDLLVNDPNVLFKISWIPQLVIAGILGATLSSALGSILGAPRIMQAVAKDHIAPSFFSKGFGASNEPRNALLLTFVIAQAGILIGDLNVIARIVTIFFIITYGFLNITYIVENWTSSDFRPSFKIPRIVGIIGALACIIVMIQLDIVALAVATLVLLGLFFYLKNKELKLQSGDTQSSIWLSLVKTGLLKLAKSHINTRNWRPNVILFSGGSGNRPHLIEIGKALVGKLGIFTNFELIEDAADDMVFDKTARVSVETIGNQDVITRKHSCRDVYEGMAMISRVYGFSGFEPNTILMGWSKNTSDSKKWEELFVTLYKLDYNLTFLNYDKGYGFGNHQKIDFWWSGKGRNLALALHLIRYITVTTKWRRAEVRILAINPDNKNTERFYAILGQIIDNYRIKASIKIINNLEKIPENDLIRAESLDTDLTIAELPELASKKFEDIVNYANSLNETLKSCLLIHASSGFEEVNIITDADGIQESTEVSGEKPVGSILSKLQLSKTELVHTKVYNLAGLLEKSTGKIIENTFFAIKESRDNFLDQTGRLTVKILEKLLKAGEIDSQSEKQLEYLRISNEFSYQAQKLLGEFKDDYLKFENELLKKGVSKFLNETDYSINTLPQNIRLTFGKDDYKYLKPNNLFKRANRAIRILWLTAYGKKVSFKVRIQPAARYFFYHKRLKYFSQFYQKYTVHSLSAFAEIRELLADNHEVISKTRSGKFSNEEILGKRTETTSIINKLHADNQTFIYARGHEMLDNLVEDIEAYSKVIESPQTNLTNRKFKPFIKKNFELENQLADFPDLWLHFMINHVNKSYLDFIYYSLKDRLASIIEKAVQHIEMLLDNNIQKNLRFFEEQLSSLMINQGLKNDGNHIFSQEKISIPQFADSFTALSAEVRTAVEELTESIEITGDELPENLQFEKLGNTVDVVVSIRRLADYYISNELSALIKRESIHVGQQLSLSISTIQNLIKLANFSFGKGEDTVSDEAESENSREQQKTLITNLLQSIRQEDEKLKGITLHLREVLGNGLKRAFDPLSSAIIIKTSTNLRKKIRETDKRKFSNRFQEFKKSISHNLVDQFVRLLYRQSQGLLWANRLEQEREKASLYPGEPINLMLEKISPKKALLQKLPFYYFNLFSGSSGIGEDFWIGMDEEVKKGSNAIQLYLKGTPGFLIISGERSSGKSVLSKHLANLHFKKQNIFNLKAPRESTADVNLFEKSLLESLNGQNDLHNCMEELPPETVIVIHDLELWWERKPFGTQVVELIIALMRQYGDKVLFIINVNKYALKIINQLCPINAWALDLVFCQPFDARELKDLILLRHKAGGMKFVLNRKPEDEMTNWDNARLFNRFFDHSSGNPGYAINLWLAGIKKISENTLYIEKPNGKTVSFPEELPQDEIIHILQFILHRRFSIKRLSDMLQNDVESTEKTIRNLFQKGILIEKFPEVFAINPALEFHLVKKLKDLDLL